MCPRRGRIRGGRGRVVLVAVAVLAAGLGLGFVVEVGLVALVGVECLRWFGQTW